MDESNQLHSFEAIRQEPCVALRISRALAHCFLQDRFTSADAPRLASLSCRRQSKDEPG